MDHARDHARGNGERKALLELVEEEIPHLLPELSVVDRGLALSRGRVRGSPARRADLVFHDGAGCALIVLVVDGREDETVLAGIDALAYARQSGSALTEPQPRIPPGEPAARVALVAETFSARVREALSLLPERELLLFEARKLNSDRGSRTCLVRLEPIPAPAAAPVSTPESFLAGVPVPLRGTVELLLRRLTRIDAGASLSLADDTLQLRRGTVPLCSLDLREGTLRGEIPALERRLPIRGTDDADAFLDGVLRSHLGSLEAGWRQAGEAEARAKRPGEPPLLTAEEIAAFQE